MNPVQAIYVDENALEIHEKHNRQKALRVLADSGIEIFQKSAYRSARGRIAGAEAHARVMRVAGLYFRILTTVCGGQHAHWGWIVDIYNSKKEAISAAEKAVINYVS